MQLRFTSLLIVVAPVAAGIRPAWAQAQSGVAMVAGTPPTAMPTAAIPGQNTYDLAAFGPVQTVEQAEATLRRALTAIQAAGGGVLVIPPTAPGGWNPDNSTQEALRKPAPPAPAKSWSTGPGVTLFDARTGRLAVPQMSGLEIERTFNLPQGDSAPHWSYHPMMNMENDYIGGTSNYQGNLQAAVAVGKGQRFYVETINGLYPGQTLEVPKPTGSVTALGDFPETTTVALVRLQSLGYDKASNRPYFVADAAVALPEGTVLRARTAMGAIHAETDAHTELQTFDVFNIRHHYSQGDTYMFDGRLHYMGDEYAPEGASPRGISGAHNSVIYNAIVKSETHVFRGVVDSFDAAKQELRFIDAKNAHTLGSGRALIDLNPKKWVTAGSAYLMNPGGAILNWGNSLRSKDAPWSAEMVGRYFAIDEPTEIIPRTENVRRWWYITGFSVDKDGSKILNVRRDWWGAKNKGVGISPLRDERNYTSDAGKPKFLKYVIAPGAEVYDVSAGVGRDETESAGGGQKLLKLAPHAWTGTPLDFEKGDPVEQAIGAEPFNPIPFRAWTFDEVPSSFPAPIFDVSNNGSVQRDSVISTRGWFLNLFNLEGSTNDLLVVNGDVSGSLIRYRQRSAARPLMRTFTWNGAQRRDLTMDARDGSLNFNGAMKLNGNSLAGLSQFGGSGGSNLRGIGVAVPAGATSFDVVFPKVEADANYAVTVQPGWLTDQAVVNQTPGGFRVTFRIPAPAGATFGWLLIH